MSKAYNIKRHRQEIISEKPNGENTDIVILNMAEAAGKPFARYSMQWQLLGWYLERRTIYIQLASAVR